MIVSDLLQLCYNLLHSGWWGLLYIKALQVIAKHLPLFFKVVWLTFTVIESINIAFCM